MPIPALTVVAGLVAVAHLGQKGSATDMPNWASLFDRNKKRIINLVKYGYISEAREIAEELGFERMDLSGSDLRNARLSGADLSKVNLSNANLNNAELRNANLIDADLTNARMEYVNLNGANLTGANLSNADLTFVNLTNVNLTGANLNNARVTFTAGIDIGPSRVFIGVPKRYKEIRSHFIPGRTSLRRIQ